MNKSILFISKHRGAASSRYRVLQFFAPMQARGWHCDYHETKKDNLVQRLRLLTRVRQYGIVVIQRKLFPSPFVALLARANPNLVFDYDDAVFLNDDGRPSLRRHARFRYVTRNARLALAGNRYLAEASACPHTLLFPTCVDVHHYPKTQPRKDNDYLTLVWIGSRSTHKYLEQYRAILEAMGMRFPSTKLNVIGDFQIDFAPLTTQCIPWSSETETAEIEAADVGIAPMSNDAWTRGKCGLKVIQYMACGLPVISSNVGANAEIIVPNETGILANNQDEWLEGLEQLRLPARREKMGRKGRQRVEEHYSLDALTRAMDAAFAEILRQKS